VSAQGQELGDRVRPAQLVADFLATFAIFAALIGVIHEPAKLCTAGVFFALVAGAMGGRDARLVPFAVILTTVCWFVGIAAAILFERPIF
jgi:hypothetical protein